MNLLHSRLTYLLTYLLTDKLWSQGFVLDFMGLAWVKVVLY